MRRRLEEKSSLEKTTDQDASQPSARTAWHLPQSFVDEPFAQAEAARLEEQWLSALQARIEADLALGRHAEPRTAR